MEIKIGTKEILIGLYILSWIIFIGLGIEAGGYIFNAVYTLSVDSIPTGYFWKEIDFSSLYAYDPGYFVVIISLIIIAAVLKALMFYLVVKILHDRNLSLSKPFSRKMRTFLLSLSFLSLGIGLFSDWTIKYSEWLVTQGVKMPDILYLRLGGADVWLFMGIMLLIIAQIFKRGMEIQSENDLTI